MLNRAIFTGFLLAAAWLDWKNRRIPVRLLEAFGGCGLAVWLSGVWEIVKTGGETGVWQIILERGLPFLPGMFLLLVSVWSREAVGRGDGCFFLASGLFLNGREIVCLLAGGLLGSSLAGLGLMMRELFRGRSAAKRELAFLPFLIPVWAALLLGG